MPGKATYIDGQLSPALSAGFGPQILLDNLPATLQPGSTLFYYNPEEENLLLQQAALKQTGKASFIDGLAPDNKQNLSAAQVEKAILYQNALEYAQANGVQLGEALTQAQVNELDKPMLWYVEQTVPDPSCTATGTASCPTITALMPQIYLPADMQAMSAGGNISGHNVTLNFNQDGNGSILNTGTISATGNLSVDTQALSNQANVVDIGAIWSKVSGGYLKTSGTQVQPGGFMAAAQMDINAERINAVNDAFQIRKADGSIDREASDALVAQLKANLGLDYTSSTVKDDIHQDFVKEKRGLPTFVVMAVAMAVAVVTAGAASAALAAAQMAAAEVGMATLIATGSFAQAAAAGGITASSAFAAGGMANLAIAGALAGMAASTASQMATSGNLNFGQILTAGAAGAVTGGLTGYFGPSFGIDRLVASAAAGCGTSAMSGGDCKSGAISSFVTASIAWAADAMRQNQIASSQRFNGIVDQNDPDATKITNISGPSAGVNGDGVKLAGTRVSLDDMKKLGNVTVRSDGITVFEGTEINPLTGKPFTLTQALERFGGPTGGAQGLGGTLADRTYVAGSFIDKLMESFAGPHDYMGGIFAYDKVGNLKEGMTAIQRTMFEIQTIIDIPLSAPFAFTTLLNQYGIDVSVMDRLIQSNREKK